THSSGAFAGLPPHFEVVDVGPLNRWRRQIWEQTALPLDLRRRGAGLLHSPHHTTPLAFSPCPRVLTVHDVTFFILPRRYPLGRRLYFQALTALSAARAAAVIVPSQSVATEAKRHLPRLPGLTAVIPEGVDPAFQPIDRELARRRIRERYHLPEQYLLSLGT